jgi:hypothetical protein
MKTVWKKSRTLPSNLVACLVVMVLAAWLEPVTGSDALGARAVMASQFEWQKQPDSVALGHDGRVVWKFNYGTNATKPFFHPVAFVRG